MTTFIEYLDNTRSAIQVILTIYDSVQRDEIVNNDRIWQEVGGGKQTIVARVDELGEWGLVRRIEMRNSYPYMKKVELTETGMEIARSLAELRDQTANIDREEE